MLFRSINDYNRTLCLLTLLSSREFSYDSECADMHWKFPPVQKIGHIPPRFEPGKGNYTCFTRHDSDGKDVGRFPHCALTYNTNDIPKMNFSSMIVARADVWWYCKTTTLRPTLPKNWKGTCALAVLTMPVDIITLHDNTTHRRRKRSTTVPGSFDNTIYIDAIGVPRGVPDEFKARNQIAAGFESVLFWWSTINKNVDWINYIYYNQQRFINYTKDPNRKV